MNVVGWQGSDEGVGSVFHSALLRFPLDYSSFVQFSAALAGSTPTSAERASVSPLSFSLYPFPPIFLSHFLSPFNLLFELWNIPFNNIKRHVKSIKDDLKDLFTNYWESEFLCVGFPHVEAVTEIHRVSGL